jgi:hypothetical protein
MNLARGLPNTAYVPTQRRVERAIPFRLAERIMRLQRDRLRAVIRYADDNRTFCLQAMDDRGLLRGDFRAPRRAAVLRQHSYRGGVST